MINWTQEIREALGPGYSDEQVRELARLSHDQLEIAVGARLTECLTDEELREFDAVFMAGDEAESQRWLAARCPDYLATVHDEVAKMLARVANARV